MLLNLLYTVFFVTLFPFVALLDGLISAIILLFTFPFDKKRRLQHKFSRFICDQLMFLSPFLRIRVRGRELVDKKQPYIIVSNHQSMIDIVFLYQVPTYFKWVSKKEVYRIPVVGQLLLMHGDVTIRRGDAHSTRKMMADCSDVLTRQNTSIMIFPEGTRSKNGRINRFKEGAFLLAKQNNVPILPVVIDGTRSFASGKLLNATQLLQLTILPPISAQEVATTDIRVMQQKVYDMMLAEHRQMAPQAYAQEPTHE